MGDGLNIESETVDGYFDDWYPSGKMMPFTPPVRWGVRTHGHCGIVELVHFGLYIFQPLMPEIRGSGVVVAGLSFIERE